MRFQMLVTGFTDLSFRVLLRESSRRRDEALEEVREEIAGFLALGLVVMVPLLGLHAGSEFALVEESEAAEPFGGASTFEPPLVNFEAVVDRLETNSLSASEIRTVQTQLKHKGFDPGPIDGIAGQRTLSALNAYRQSIRLSPVLAVSRETVSALKSQ
ncbi:peptidoglycan-binding domain-containing protein [Dongia deserti]|uniref:peptidoglycan-binding domain-containing protein n=1 Tax=Dongia deserti TaxID=2268030 RepID=UPI000E659BA7|nr:peptidoglycan-binding domain-containing protein [Dongia deserti]